MSQANAFYMKVAGLCFLVCAILCPSLWPSLRCLLSDHACRRWEGAWRDL